MSVSHVSKPNAWENPKNWQDDASSDAVIKTNNEKDIDEWGVVKKIRKKNNKSNDKSKNESNNESNNKSNNESNNKSNDESNNKSNDESNDKSNDESNDKSKNESNDESNDKSNDEYNNKSNEETNDKSNNETNNETNNEFNNKLKEQIKKMEEEIKEKENFLARKLVEKKILADNQELKNKKDRLQEIIDKLNKKINNDEDDIEDQPYTHSNKYDIEDQPYTHSNKYNIEKNNFTENVFEHIINIIKSKKNSIITNIRNSRTQQFPIKIENEYINYSKPYTSTNHDGQEKITVFTALWVFQNINSYDLKQVMIKIAERELPDLILKLSVKDEGSNITIYCKMHDMHEY